MGGSVLGGGTRTSSVRSTVGVWSSFLPCCLFCMMQTDLFKLMGTGSECFVSLGAAVTVIPRDARTFATCFASLFAFGLGGGGAGCRTDNVIESLKCITPPESELLSGTAPCTLCILGSLFASLCCTLTTSQSSSSSSASTLTVADASMRRRFAAMDAICSGVLFTGDVPCCWFPGCRIPFCCPWFSIVRARPRIDCIIGGPPLPLLVIMGGRPPVAPPLGEYGARVPTIDWPPRGEVIRGPP